MRRTGWMWTLAALLAALACSAQARDEVRTLRVQEDQVTVWNRFADNLYQLHRQLIEGKKIVQTESFGGYAGLPRFYREVTYTDAASQQVISRIQWERENPAQIHMIEVYRYDSGGRLTHDYMAWYLPLRRNAPRATAVNLYHYGDGLRGWRQFDASDNRTYEKCSEWRDGREGPMRFDLSDDRIAAVQDDPHGIMASDLYRRCFGDLPESAGPLLTPQ